MALFRKKKAKDEEVVDLALDDEPEVDDLDAFDDDDADSQDEEDREDGTEEDQEEEESAFDEDDEVRVDDDEDVPDEIMDIFAGEVDDNMDLAAFADLAHPEMAEVAALAEKVLMKLRATMSEPG